MGSCRVSSDIFFFCLWESCSFVFGGESWAESATAGKPSAKGSLDLSPRSSEATNPDEDGGLWRWESKWVYHRSVFFWTGGVEPYPPCFLMNPSMIIWNRSKCAFVWDFVDILRELAWKDGRRRVLKCSWVFDSFQAVLERNFAETDFWSETCSLGHLYL